MACLHLNFRADVTVARLTDVEGGPVTGYAADVRIRCLDCDKPFVFLGLPMGYSAVGAHVSVDGQEARLGLAPAGEMLPPAAGAVGFTITRSPGRGACDA